MKGTTASSITVFERLWRSLKVPTTGTISPIVDPAARRGLGDSDREDFRHSSSVYSAVCPFHMFDMGT